MKPAFHPPISLCALLRFSSKRDKLFLCIGSLVAMVTGFSWNLLTIAFGDAVDVFVRFENHERLIVNGSNSSSSDHSSLFLKDIYFYSSSLFFLWILNTFFNFIILLLFPLAAKSQISRIKKLYFRALLRQDKNFFDQSESGGGDFASRVTADLKRVEEGLGEKLGLAVYHVSTALIALGTAFLYGWELTLIILSLLPFLAFGTTIMNKVQAQMARKEVEAYSSAGTVAEETISAIRTVFAFNRQNFETKRFSELLEPSLKSGIKRNLMTGCGNGLMFLCLYLGLALGIYFGVQMVHQNPNYSLGTIVIVFWCVSGAGFSIGGAAPHFEAVKVAQSTAARVFHVIDHVPKIDAQNERGLRPEVVRAEVEFRDVHFRYPIRPEVPVLQGFSLKIGSGQSCALVGPSGGGKSTVIQLLQRFYDPIEGAVVVDNNDVRDWNLSHLRNQMGVVGQEPQLFDCSLFENIALGSNTKYVQQSDVEAVSKLSHAHDFIQQLPFKYETRVGSCGGCQLSGGQKQRVAIARALIKEPKVLLLDEATSALDNQSEALVQQALEEAARGRTTIIVAHRLSTIVNCDKIVYIESGRVLEEGDHVALMALKGSYYRLVTKQQLVENESEGSEPEADSMPEVEVKVKEEEQEVEMESELVEEEVLKKFSNKRLFRMLLLDKFYLISGLVLSFLYGLVVPIYAFIFGQFVEVFANSLTFEEIQQKSQIFAFYYVLIALSVGLIAVSQMALLGVASERLTLRLRRMAFEAIMRQEITWFDRPENASGALCARLSSDAANVQGASGSRMAIILQALSTFMTSAFLGFALNWMLSLVAALFTPLILIGSAISASVDTWESKHARSTLEESTRVALEALVNIGTVQSLQKEQKFCEKFEKIIERDDKSHARKCVLRALTLAFCLSVVFLAYATVFLFGGYLAKNKLLTSGHFFIIIETLIYGSMTVGQSSVFTSDYRKAKLAAANIFRLIDRKPRQPTGNEVPEELKGDIRFQNVHFRYPSRPSHPVLNGLNLEVTSGQTVALVGASGCGKSTSVQLLEKFYETSFGQITIDGHALSSLETTWLRENVSLVSQEPNLFSMTIRENIAYGLRAETEVQFSQVVRAAQMASIHSFISELPKGYETRVGPKGTQLSGGQRQRLAIARALIREPKVLLLDEATSALDTEAEKAVQEALDACAVGRTVVVIAHRLSTVRNAEKICVLSKGRVVEEGKHEELISKRGKYYDLYNFS